MAEVYLKKNRYGKEQVKFLKKVVDAHNPKLHTVYEFSVMILLQGDFTESYTTGDNAKVIPTDTMKNSIYILAKQHEFTEPEIFAAIVASHFTTLSRFKHILSAECSVSQSRWSRITIAQSDGHPHSFYRDGDEQRTASCTSIRDGGIKVQSGIKDLLVLKTTGSSFYGFMKDEWTTLPEVKDRLFSTSVTCDYNWATFNDLDQVSAYSRTFQAAFAGARQTTLQVFAEDDSCSVQATLYKMCESIIGQFGGIAEVEYTLPNQHYFPVNMDPFAIDNNGQNTTIYTPQAYPSGHINACVARKAESIL